MNFEFCNNYNRLNIRFLGINAAVDTIIKRYRKGLIAKVKFTTPAPIAKAALNTDGDCEHQSGEIYLVAATYPNEKEALNAVQILIKNGFYKAGFVYDKSVYRVYLDQFPNFKTASTELAIQKVRFNDAYLFQKNQ